MSGGLLAVSHHGAPSLAHPKVLWVCAVTRHRGEAPGGLSSAARRHFIRCDSQGDGHLATSGSAGSGPRALWRGQEAQDQPLPGTIQPSPGVLPVPLGSTLKSHTEVCSRWPRGTANVGRTAFPLESQGGASLLGPCSGGSFSARRASWGHTGPTSFVNLVPPAKSLCRVRTWGTEITGAKTAYCTGSVTPCVCQCVCACGVRAEGRIKY